MALGKRKSMRKPFVPPKIQITSMMDMFTIILIFLLFSFSENPDNIDVDKDLVLPQSSSKLNYKNSIKLVLSKDRLLMEGIPIAYIQGDEFSEINMNNPKESVLFKKLVQQREKDLLDNEKKDTHILFLCDKSLSFKLINTVVKTAGMAGYPNFQFAVLEN